MVVLTGASAALGTTPGMLGYGMSKAATHFLVQSMAADPLFRKATVAAILPVTIDTPSNRMAMPNAKHDDWTKVAEQEPRGLPLRPSGSHVNVSCCCSLNGALAA